MLLWILVVVISLLLFFLFFCMCVCVCVCACVHVRVCWKPMLHPEIKKFPRITKHTWQDGGYLVRQLDQWRSQIFKDETTCTKWKHFTSYSWDAYLEHLWSQWNIAVKFPMGNISWPSDLDFWPMTLTYEPDLDILLSYFQYQIHIFFRLAQRVTRTDTHTDRQMLS